MRYRLGILGGLAIIGIVALALATGISGSGTVEAARPSVRVTTHELMVAPATTEGECSFALNIGWEGTAYAHKNGHYYLFLWSKNNDGADVLVNFEKGTVAKGTGSDIIPSRLFSGSPRAVYRSRIVFYTSKGKDGAKLGRQLEMDQQHLELVC